MSLTNEEAKERPELRSGEVDFKICLGGRGMPRSVLLPPHSGELMICRKF